MDTILSKFFEALSYILRVDLKKKKKITRFLQLSSIHIFFDRANELTSMILKFLSIRNSKRNNRDKYSSSFPRTCTLRCDPCSVRVSSAFHGCIFAAPLEKASFPFPLVAQEKRSIPLSIAREKMRFPLEFLHLNEARGIRSRRRKRRKTESHIYTCIHNPVSNSFARTTVALRPAPVIRLHPTTSIVFFHFSTQETASLVDLFISSCFALSKLASFSLFIVV